MGAGEDYVCPDCGAFFSEHARRCPGCGAALDWDDLDLHETEEGGDGVLRLVDPRLPHVEGGDEGGEDVGTAPPLCSPFGWVCMVLTVAAFLGTIVLLRWDTIVHDAAEESIGSSQRLMVYTGLAATTVLAAFTIVDILRTQFGSREGQ